MTADTGQLSAYLTTEGNKESIAIWRSTCRSCTGKLSGLVDFGEVIPAGFEQGALQDIVKAPLHLCRCEDCNLVQLHHTANADFLFKNWYGYRSGTNEHMVRDLTSITESASSMVELNSGDIVLDIGSNDGTLLDQYKADVVRVGFDPAFNVAKYSVPLLQGHGVNRFAIFFDFFDKKNFERKFPYQTAKIVTAISMFYDLDDPNKFLQDVKSVLDDDGVFVIQQNYLVRMLAACAFDNIVHEHLTYFSLSSLIPLLERNGLEVFDVNESDINGGSFRTYVRHIGSNIKVEGGSERVAEMLNKEAVLGLTTEGPYVDFAKRATQNLNALKSFVTDEVGSGKTVHAYAASTRGNTLLQIAGIDGNLIAKVAERNPDKWGRSTVGTNIPIVPEAETRDDHPDYLLILPWFLKKVFIDREMDYLKKGGKMIIPLPSPHLVYLDEGGRLVETPVLA